MASNWEPVKGSDLRVGDVLRFGNVTYKIVDFLDLDIDGQNGDRMRYCVTKRTISGAPGKGFRVDEHNPQYERLKNKTSTD